MTPRIRPRWIAIATLILAAAGGSRASDAGADAGALALQPEATEVITPAATKVFVEGLVGRADQRYDLGPQTVSRASIDLRHASRLAASTLVAVSARLDATHPSDPRISGALLSLREAYVGWQNEAATQMLQFGRVSLRDGPGYGYNPTDFFRDGTLRTLTTSDPKTQRELRLGSVMLRGQRLWSGGSVALQLSPKLLSSPSDEGVNADLGATNNRNRGVLSLGHRISEKLDTQWLLQKEDGASARVGASLSALVSDSAVLHAEWTYSREPELLARALQLRADEIVRNRVVLGLTYTTASRLSVTAEYQYNGFALDRVGWQAMSRLGLPAQAAYYGAATSLQDNASRGAWLLYAMQPNLGLKNLDLTALLKFNQTDRSRMVWLDLRYRFDKADLALQFQRNTGASASEFGVTPVKDAVSIVGVAYF